MWWSSVRCSLSRSVGQSPPYRSCSPPAAWPAPVDSIRLSCSPARESARCWPTRSGTGSAAPKARWSLTVLAAALAGYIAWKYVGRQRFLRQIRIARITPEELKRRLDDGVDMLVVDVRDRLDFEAEPSIIPGALHLTLEELEDRHHEIPRAREIVLYCT